MALFGLSFAALGLSLSARPLTMLTSPFRMPAPVRMVSIDSNIKQDAEAVFSVVDVDGDGTVTKEELMSHLTASGYKAEAVEKIFEKLDIDKSGCLSLEELIAGFANYTPLRKAPGFGNYNEQFKELIHADADALFNAIDGNNDGEITDAELRVHLRQFSNFSDAAITNIFSMLDTNANGGVDRKELRSAFVRSSALRQAIGQGPNFK
eukprot:jgi/Chrpa1/6637/Chrysochromulina_OHIO_Genome00014248-RA